MRRSSNAKGQTFEEWSHMWDAIFNLMEKGKLPTTTLLEHTLEYNPLWNFEV